MRGRKESPLGRARGLGDYSLLSVGHRGMGTEWKNSIIGKIPLLEIFAGSCEMGGKFLGFCWP